MRPEKENVILVRSKSYALRIVLFYREIYKDTVGNVLGKQLLRSGTSVGANIHEAQGAQSRRDFIMKMSIAYKEARESCYWIELFIQAGILTEKADSLLTETKEILRILTSILFSTKRNGN